jgi:phage baseplate assembly protein W
MTASYTGMNPEGTGSLTDHDQLWQSVTKILTTPTGSCDAPGLWQRDT